VTWSFDALVRLARRAVPNPLAPPSTWPPPGMLATAWPLQVAVAGGVECRLGHLAQPADLAFAISVASGGRARLAASGGGAESADGVWRFLRRWCDPSTSLHVASPVVWLEFDHALLAAGRPYPFLVYTIDDDVPSEAATAALHLGVEALAGPAAKPLACHTMRCLSCLPPAGRLLHVGVMHGRLDAVRLIMRMHRSQIATFLGRVAWPGDGGAVGTAVAALWPEDERVSVHLDVGGRIGARVGVEFYRPTSPVEDRRWEPLLEGLTRAGLCAAEKRRAIATWPTAHADGCVGRSSLVRELLVKVVFEGDAAYEAKAYLAFTPHVTLFGSPARRRQPSARDS
jgi:hypothetical protein